MNSYVFPKALDAGFCGGPAVGHIGDNLIGVIRGDIVQSGHACTELIPYLLVDYFIRSHPVIPQLK